MAIIEIAKEFKEKNDPCMAILEERFTVFKPLIQITPSVLRYEVQGEDIPEGDQKISVVFQDIKGVITIKEIKIL